MDAVRLRAGACRGFGGIGAALGRAWRRCALLFGGHAVARPSGGPARPLPCPGRGRGGRSGPAGRAEDSGQRRSGSAGRAERPGRLAGEGRSGPAGRVEEGAAARPSGRRRGERPGRLGGGRKSPPSGCRATAFWPLLGLQALGRARGARVRAATVRVHMLLDIQKGARFAFQQSTKTATAPALGFHAHAFNSGINRGQADSSVNLPL